MGIERQDEPDQEEKVSPIQRSVAGLDTQDNRRRNGDSRGYSTNLKPESTSKLDTLKRRSARSKTSGS